MLTRADGRFVFEDLPEGVANLSVRKPGFFFGASGTSRRRRSVLFKVGPEATEAIVTLTPEATLSGHIEGKGGEPLEGVSIEAVRLDVNGGRRYFDRSMNSVAVSDEDGNFIITDLAPGRYYAVLKMARTFARTTGDHLRPAKDGYPASAYYPASPEGPSPTFLNLGPGQHELIQISIKPVPTFHVSGVVRSDSSWQHINSPQLLDSAGEMLSVPIEFGRSSGKFDLGTLPAGAYKLRIHAQDQDGRAADVERSIEVGSNLRDIVLALEPNISVAISVHRDFKKDHLEHGHCSMTHEGRVFDCTKMIESHVHVVLHSRKSGSLDATAMIDPRSDPPLFYVTLSPGRYRAELATAVGYIKTARFGSVDLLRDDLEISRGVTLPEIEISLGDEGGTLAGMVRIQKPVEQASVLLVPESVSLAPSTVIWTNAYGVFQRELAPGAYKAYAFEDVEQIEYTNPDALEKYASQAVHVVLAVGETTNVTLDLIPAAR